MGAEMRDIEEIPVNAGKLWSGADLNELENHFEAGTPLVEIARLMGRTTNGISSQLVRMNLVINRGGLLYKCDRNVWADNRNIRSKGKCL